MIEGPSTHRHVTRWIVIGIIAAGAITVAAITFQSKSSSGEPTRSAQYFENLRAELWDNRKQQVRVERLQSTLDHSSMSDDQYWSRSNRIESDLARLRKRAVAIRGELEAANELLSPAEKAEEKKQEANLRAVREEASKLRQLPFPPKANYSQCFQVEEWEQHTNGPIDLSVFIHNEGKCRVLSSNGATSEPSLKAVHSYESQKLIDPFVVRRNGKLQVSDSASVDVEFSKGKGNIYNWMTETDPWHASGSKPTALIEADQLRLDVAVVRYRMGSGTYDSCGYTVQIPLQDLCVLAEKSWIKIRFGKFADVVLNAQGVEALKEMVSCIPSGHPVLH